MPLKVGTQTETGGVENVGCKVLEVPHFNYQWSRLDIIWHYTPASCRLLKTAPAVDSPR